LPGRLLRIIGCAIVAIVALIATAYYGEIAPHLHRIA